MGIRSFCRVVLWGLCATGTVAFGADQTHPRIPGYERFYASAPPKPTDDDDESIKLDPVLGGRLLLSELNCTSCHAEQADAKVRLSRKQAPVLDEIGTRVKIDWLRAYLTNPQAIKPGTTMPDLIAALPAAERAASVEALTHFLASTGTMAEIRPDPAAAAKGATLFHKVGCLACHNDRQDNSPDLATSAPLPDVGKKYSAPSLMVFLKDPLKPRPSGRMPSLGLTDEEVRNLAHYFVREGVTTPNVSYALYHGSWNAMPKFRDLKPVAQGETSGFDVAVADRPGNFAIQFTSYLQIRKAGEYRFWLGSDDGSKLIIDDQVIVDNDAVHPFATNQGRTTLTTGFHKVVVEFFQGGGEATLVVNIAGQDLTRQPLSGFAFLEPCIPAPVPGSQTSTFSLDSNLVARGRELFATLGCASCHQLNPGDQPVATRLKAKALADVSADAGCLAETVKGSAPRYALTATQRASLTLAIKSPMEESPAETVQRTLMAMNCYACHQRDKVGGVEEARNATFESLQKEMGDEGRLPPTLTGVGDKLRPEWLKQVLNNSADDRKHYLVTRMPKFGPSNVEPLGELLTVVDLRPDTMPKADFAEPEYRVKSAGRHLVGGHALSCIKCHDFGPHPSTGVRAINLSTMTQRLRPDWFYRYVLDPQTYRRGTRMPAPWPFGQATIRDTLNADVNQQIQAVWSYLADRDKASVPYGLIRESIELKPQSEPIIYRNFIEGAGTRAIGVGYPEGVNLAFDANNLRLALIWHGPFIDASRHWTGRGAGFEPPLGDDILPSPNQVPFLVLDKPEQEFPKELTREAGDKFLGYELDTQQRPIFRYSMSHLTVKDHFEPVKGTDKAVGLKRTLQFQGTGETSPLYYRAAVADKLEDAGAGQYRIDHVWTTEISATGPDKPSIRTSAGKKELLVPIRLKNGQATISQAYIW